VWLLDNILTGPGSVLDDVDTWEGSDEAAHKRMDFADVEHVYDERTAAARWSCQLMKHKMTSRAFFDAYHPIPRFDFVYIDGDHTAYSVLNDAMSAYRVLKVGGLLAFDDYQWKSGKGNPHDPGLAIDAFGTVYADRLELLEVGAQVWFRRTA
jgi:hypothetical protein